MILPSSSGHDTQYGQFFSEHACLLNKAQSFNVDI